MGIAHQCYFLKNHKNVIISDMDQYSNAVNIASPVDQAVSASRSC